MVISQILISLFEYPNKLAESFFAVDFPVIIVTGNIFEKIHHDEIRTLFFSAGSACGEKMLSSFSWVSIPEMIEEGFKFC
jgi:hypothetical protein